MFRFNLRKKTLFYLFITVLYGISLSPGKLWAQAPCGNFDNVCNVDSDCDDGVFCNGPEDCVNFGPVDVPTIRCRCGTPPAPLTPCGDDTEFCNGINVCNEEQQCVPENTLFQNPRCGANEECGLFCDEVNDICAVPAGTPCKDDGNICTTDACNGVGPIGSCVSSNNDFLCDDTINCTLNDVCSGGVCSGTPLQCDDQISCTPNVCDEPTGQCQFDNSQCECQTDADCDDQNLCTDEFCCTDQSCIADGTIFTCIRSNNSLPCDDSLFCNGPDTCGGGTCSVHAGDPCNGGGQCAQSCDESGDNCFAPTGLACDDGDLITITECDGKGACLTVANIATQGSSLFGCSLGSGGNAPIEIGALASLVGLPGLLFFYGRLRHRNQGRPN